MVGKIYYKKDSKVRKDLNCRSKSIFKIGVERLIPAITYKHYEPKEYEKYFSIFSPFNKAFKDFVVEWAELAKILNQDKQIPLLKERCLVLNEIGK